MGKEKTIDVIKKEGSQLVFKRDDGSIGVMTINEEPTMTQQQFKEEVDINNIMEKYIKRPDPTIFVRNGKGVYGDFSNAKDFQSSLNQILEAEDAFMSLDARIRARFENDPHKLFEFLNDRKNLDEAIELGLVENKNANVNEKTTNEQTKTNANTETKS